MVAQQPQLQLQPQQPTPSPQDEALKRNTDCVYFLASPLTCKKGNECEYRHSEYARVNPRDCRYWLNGNCLNPNCSFRHPPLDGLLGTPATTPGGSSVAPTLPPSQFSTVSATHAHHNSTKQAVPCIFFQKGLCLKGDRCAFSHGTATPNTSNNKVGAQVPPVTSQGSENPSFKQAFGSTQKYTQERKAHQGNAVKSGGGPEAKPAPKVQTAPQKNMFELEKKVPPSSEASTCKRNSPPVTNGPVARPNRLQQARVPDDHTFHSDEFLRESSPGFDVLVADEMRNSDYFHGEDEFGARGQDEHDLGHSGDYNLPADIDRERFRLAQGYESYDHMQDAYGWEQQQRKAPAHSDRRTRRRSDSPDNAGVSDLRHHLSKRRKGNGLKSVVSHNYEGHGEDQSHRSFSRKDSLNDSSLGSRFRGRITLPANGGDNLEREDRGRFGSRLSSGGRLLAPHQGRIHDRLRGRLPDDERRSSKDRLMGRELTADRIDFAGPKSLAELKNGRSSENKEQNSLGRRRGLRDHPQSDDDFLFEDPKPLSEILKEKRGAGADADKNEKVSNGSDPIPVRNTQNGVLSEANEEPKLQATDSAGDFDSTQGQVAGEMIYQEPREDQYYEGEEDQRDGDLDYEQGDEEYYEYEQGEEGENQEQDYMDDDDGDDFAKQIGAIQP